MFVYLSPSNLDKYVSLHPELGKQVCHRGSLAMTVVVRCQGHTHLQARLKLHHYALCLLHNVSILVDNKDGRLNGGVGDLRRSRLRAKRGA